MHKKAKLFSNELSNIDNQICGNSTGTERSYSLSGEKRGLTSATSLLGGLPRRLKHLHCGELLRSGGVDAHSAVQVTQTQPLAECHSQPLHDLTRVGGGNMNAHHIGVGVRLVDDNLGHAAHSLMVVFSHCPLQRRELAEHAVHLVLTKHLNGLVLRQAYCAQLQGGEHCSGHLLVLHNLLGVAEKAASQQDPSLNGGRSELRHAVHHISNGINIGDVSLLVVAGNLSVACISLHASSFEVQSGGIGVPASSHQHSVELVLLSVAHLDQQLAGVQLGD
mmetsp:Transcript_17177/g.28735  ORF Transcript_17177/g.28735 Transcript_17177/m.28735 type:complete len:278 (-) Transcript_17177:1108-1941(-)